MNEFGLTPTTLDTSMNAESLLELYELSPDDLKRVKAFGNLVTPRLDEYVEAFYAWLETQPQFHQFFADAENLARVQRMQVDYWRIFFEAQVDDPYVARLHRVGEAHARIGLSLPTYFAAMSMSLTLFMDKLYDNSLSEAEYGATVRSVTKLMHLDTAIVVETFSRLTMQTITEQSKVLIEMSTPVAEIWQDVDVARCRHHRFTTLSGHHGCHALQDCGDTVANHHLGYQRRGCGRHRRGQPSYQNHQGDQIDGM